MKRTSKTSPINQVGLNDYTAMHHARCLLDRDVTALQTLRKAARGVADIDASRRCVTAEVHRSEVPARHEQQGGKRERTRTDGHYTRFAGKAKEFRCGRPTGQLVSWQDNVTHVPTPP